MEKLIRGERETKVPPGKSPRLARQKTKSPDILQSDVGIFYFHEMYILSLGERPLLSFVTAYACLLADYNRFPSLGKTTVGWKDFASSKSMMA